MLGGMLDTQEECWTPKEECWGMLDTQEGGGMLDTQHIPPECWTPNISPPTYAQDIPQYLFTLFYP
jgi:hypothetical protein